MVLSIGAVHNFAEGSGVLFPVIRSDQLDMGFIVSCES